MSGLTLFDRHAPLDGIGQARSSLDYVHRNLDALDGEMRAWAGSEAKPYDIVPYPDPKTGQQVFRFVVIRDPPADWGKKLGAIANEMRSLLNYAIHGVAVPDTEEIGFPIYRVKHDYVTPAKTRKASERISPRDRYLAGVPEPIRKYVDSLQPWQRGDDADSDPLAMLADLTNLHKHRAARTAFATFVNVRAKVIPLGKGIHSSILVRAGARLKNHVEIARVLSVNPPGLQVAFEGQVAVEISFGERRITTADVFGIERHIIEIVERLDAARTVPPA